MYAMLWFKVSLVPRLKDGLVHTVLYMHNIPRKTACYVNGIRDLPPGRNNLGRQLLMTELPALACGMMFSCG